MSKFVKIVERDDGNCMCINLDQVVLVDEFIGMVLLNTTEQKYRKIFLHSDSIRKIISELGV